MMCLLVTVGTHFQAGGLFAALCVSQILGCPRVQLECHWTRYTVSLILVGFSCHVK